MKNYILSIDIGTSGVKVILLNIGSKKLAARSASYRTQNPAPGHYQQDPRDW